MRTSPWKAGFEGLDWRTLICCSGAQNAMAIAFAALCKPGDMILCEAATFSGAKALAAQLGYRLHGVEMDMEGIRPQSLDRAAASTGARVLYTLPTLQNPTARNGLRLCIGSAANRTTLERALSILKGALKGEVDDRTRASL